MRTYKLFLLFVLSLLLTPSAQAATEITSDITANTTWTKAGSPYMVRNVTLRSGVTLTIEPGVIVKFAKKVGGWSSEFSIRGTLVVNGTESEKVYFTSITDDTVGGDSNGDGGATSPGSYRWDGFDTYGPSGSVNMRGAVVRYLSYSIYIDQSSGTFDQVQFENSAGGLGFWRGSNYVITNSSFRQIKDGIGIQLSSGSTVRMASTTLENFSGWGGGIRVSDANLELENVLIKNVPSDAIDFYGGTGVINGLTMDNVDYGLYASDAALIIENSSIANSRWTGMGLYGGDTAIYADNLTVDTTGDVGVDIWGNTSYGTPDIYLSRAKLRNNALCGVMSVDTPALLAIVDSEIEDNMCGVSVENMALTIENSSITNNFAFGLEYSGSSALAENNWWGDASGPYHETLNPSGLGDEVIGTVDFDPWLKAKPGAAPACCSSVVFIPGVKASRLHLGDNKLWEPNRTADIEKLFLDGNGESLNPDVRVGTILDEVFGVSNIYQGFMDEMDGLVATGTIKAWQALPYDWRKDLFDTVFDPVQTTTGSYDMVAQISELADESITGKVTIVTHSNGGLVAKTLIDELKVRGMEELVDKLVMVAPPQLGTPQALLSLLHGDGEDLVLGILLDQGTAREFGERMKSAYNLLPSRAYFDTVAEPVVVFDPSVDNYNPKWREKYGESVDTYAELADFLQGDGGERSEPESNNVRTPNVLREAMLARASGNHAVLDDWVPPDGINVYQIAGWGLSTVKGLKYSSKRNCYPAAGVCDEYKLYRQPLFTDDGDKIIVTPSAITQTFAGSYYIDLYLSNRGLNLDRQHKDIFENESILKLLNNIFTQQELKSDNYIRTEKPQSQGRPNLKISVHSPVAVHVYDSANRHTGIVDAEIPKIEEQIPNSTYLQIGEEKYINLDKEDVYSIALDGYETGTFTFKIEEVINDIVGKVILFSDLPVAPETKGTLSIGENLDEIKLSLTIASSTIEVKPDGQNDKASYFEIIKNFVQLLNIEQDIRGGILNQLEIIKKQIGKENYKNVGQNIENLEKFVGNHLQNQELITLLQLLYKLRLIINT